MAWECPFFILARRTDIPVRPCFCYWTDRNVRPYGAALLRNRDVLGCRLANLEVQFADFLDVAAVGRQHLMPYRQNHLPAFQHRDVLELEVAIFVGDDGI